MNINAASSADNFTVNNFDAEPPDQGLCAGAGKVLEPVNDVMGVFSTSGALLAGQIPMSSVFGEPVGSYGTFLSDPRCVFDTSSATFIITELAIDASGITSHLDIGVMAATSSTITTYRVATTDAIATGCPCFGDQPRLGLDAQNVYVASDEFAINGPAFGGSQILAVSRTQLESLASAPRAVAFLHLVDAGVPVRGLQPAITSGRAPAEFFAHSFVATASGSPQLSDDRIGVFAMTHERAVGSGGTPTLSAPVVTTVARYTQPVGAVNPNGFALNPDDDRLQQLQYIKGKLWTTLSAAVKFSRSNALYDGIAWIELSVGLAGSSPTVSVTAESLIASRGIDLLFPAITEAPNGAAAIAMSLTGQTLNPSAAYVTRSSGSQAWGTIFVAATGAAADNGPTCAQAPTCRWGDYSAVTVDPATGHFWAAAEYVAPFSSDSDTIGGYCNWGTRVLEIG